MVTPLRLGFVFACIGIAACHAPENPKTEMRPTERPVPVSAPEPEPEPEPAQTSMTEPAPPTEPVQVGTSAPEPSEVDDGGEVEFAALHRPGAVLPRRGEAIEVGGARAYLSLPQGVEAPMPGIVLVHEWWGLNENVMHWADRLAAEGYAAIAIDLFHGLVTTEIDAAKEAQKAVDPAKAIATMIAASRFLETEPRIRAPRTAAIGWSFGASQALQLALAAPDLDACVVYYGSPITDAAALAPMNASLLGIYGTRDKSIEADKVDEFEKALRSAGKTFEIKRFDAEHAFANPTTARYDETSAAAAWNEVRAFLKIHLATPR